MADNAARIIQGAQAIYEGCSTEEKAELDVYLAEAYALRGYAQLVLTNVFAHQVKVNGTDFSGEPGIVVIDTPIPALTQVSRSTVGQSYEAVLSDFNNALTHFDAAGGDRGSDCRTSLFDWTNEPTAAAPQFAGGKFSCFDSGNPANATNYIVNAPEMFLILAEANLKSANVNVTAAQNALLTVARRNADITSVGDLPSTANDLMAFIKDERARELFQEGLRLYDLRRWDERAEIYAYGAPSVSFTFSDYQISNLLFPIPSAEITSGFGVEQNDWSGTLPH